MSFRCGLSVLAVLAVAGCQGTPDPSSNSTQAIVESVAAQHPECVRLSVHAVPPAGGDYRAVASTSPAKLGTPSDKEDLDAMKSGQTLVLDEPGAIDVTVPILSKDGRWTATCGVTVKAGPGADRAALVVNAKAIAASVETAILAASNGM
ncbi:MAG TPA: hypothetical protein VFZ65_01835 [Planctomycetota bacterium]|nr:hypothetical protein [Planctomycetota bacterium]